MYAGFAEQQKPLPACIPIFSHPRHTIRKLTHSLNMLKVKVSKTRFRMRVPKMAELQFEAPLASFENEEWSEYNEFQGANVDAVKPQSIDQNQINQNGQHETDEGSQFGETVSGSLEDLVNSFDERITKCFNNLEEQVENFAPVQIRTQEEVVNDCQ